MIYESELRAMKDWRVRKTLRDLRNGYEYAKTHQFGLRRLMMNHYEEEIPRLERELERTRAMHKSHADS